MFQESGGTKIERDKPWFQDVYLVSPPDAARQIEDHVLGNVIKDVLSQLWIVGSSSLIFSL